MSIWKKVFIYNIYRYLSHKHIYFYFLWEKKCILGNSFLFLDIVEVYQISNYWKGNMRQRHIRKCHNVTRKEYCDTKYREETLK